MLPNTCQWDKKQILAAIVLLNGPELNWFRLKAKFFRKEAEIISFHQIKSKKRAKNLFYGRKALFFAKQMMTASILRHFAQIITSLLKKRLLRCIATNGLPLEHYLSTCKRNFQWPERISRNNFDCCLFADLRESVQLRYALAN